MKILLGQLLIKNKTYKIDPSSVPAIQDGGLKREVSKIYPAEDKLTIASYNIENFSANNNGHDETPEEKLIRLPIHLSRKFIVQILLL